MKSTGIVRKVDELGRVVIPKEIRKTSFISEGTPLEIYSGDDGEIIFKKYSSLKNLNTFATEAAESLNDFTKGKVIVFDTTEVVASSGINLKNASNFFIENNLQKIHTENGYFSINEQKFFIEHIKTEGKIIGGIMVWNVEEFSLQVLASIKIISMFLGRLMN